MSSYRGIVDELDPTEVDNELIEYLKFVLFSLCRSGAVFECTLCGEEREAPFADPGNLMLRDFTCGMVGKKCKKPPRPSARKRTYFYRPGSLVLAQLGPNDQNPWPAIIEDPPHGNDSFMIRGKHDHSEPRAYWVTFIFPEGGQWRGGYLPTSQIRPLVPGRIPDNAGPERRGALERAYEGLAWPLKKRLKAFSFVAHVARQRGIKLEGGGRIANFFNKVKRKATDQIQRLRKMQKTGEKKAEEQPGDFVTKLGEALEAAKVLQAAKEAEAEEAAQAARFAALPPGAASTSRGTRFGSGPEPSWVHDSESDDD